MSISRLRVRPKPSTFQDAAEHRVIRGCATLLPHLEIEHTFVPRGSIPLPKDRDDRTQLAARPDFAARVLPYPAGYFCALRADG